MANKAVFGIATTWFRRSGSRTNSRRPGSRETTSPCCSRTRKAHGTSPTSSTRRRRKAPRRAREPVASSVVGWDGSSGLARWRFPGRPVHRRRTHHGCPGWCGGRRGGWWSHRRTRRSGYSRVRGQAVRGQDPRGNILISVHTEDGKESTRPRTSSSAGAPRTSRIPERRRSKREPRTASTVRGAGARCRVLHCCAGPRITQWGRGGPSLARCRSSPMRPSTNRTSSAPTPGLQPLRQAGDAHHAVHQVG